MNKEQFLDELEKLLQDIDSIERDEALNYYRDYFECALVALVVVAIKMFMDGLIAGGLICLGVGLLLFSLSYLTSLMTVSIFKYLPQAFRALIDLGKDIYNKVVG